MGTFYFYVYSCAVCQLRRWQSDDPGLGVLLPGSGDWHPKEALRQACWEHRPGLEEWDGHRSSVRNDACIDRVILKTRRYNFSPDFPALSAFVPAQATSSWSTPTAWWAVLDSTLKGRRRIPSSQPWAKSWPTTWPNSWRPTMCHRSQWSRYSNFWSCIKKSSRVENIFH